MHIELTEKEFTKTLNGMSTKRIVDYLMAEGLSLKADKLDFSDLPRGVYRRVEGLDLIYHGGNGVFNFIDTSGRYDKLDIAWTLRPGGEWWIQVLNVSNNPVRDGLRFQVNENGERLT